METQLFMHSCRNIDEKFRSVRNPVYNMHEKEWQVVIIMKRKTAKEILAESFRELAGKKAANKITVADITENCGYSATTFYRQFRDKYDLMAWEYTRQIEEIMNSSALSDADWRQICLTAARFFDNQKDYLKNLLMHTEGDDSFIQDMKQIHFEAVCGCLENAMGADRLDSKTEMYVWTYCHGCIDLSCDWIMGKYDVTAEELAEVFVKSIPEPIRRFLI